MNLAEQESSLFFHTYKRLPLEIDHGKGCYLYARDGRKYLDMFSGLAVNALGYAHPAVVAAIETQSRKYTHLSNFFLQEPQILLAERLLKLTGFDKIFFTNSGTEANEGCIKLVRKWGNRKNKKFIFGMTNGFSGRTMGALSLMDKEKYREGYEPFLPNFDHIEFNNVSDLKQKINESTAAVFLEFVQGEGGIVPVSKEFISTLIDLRTKYDFLLVADEIQSGIGRSGKFFCYEYFEVLPDLVTIAKPIGGGLPLGAILGTKKVSDVWSPGVHGTTFGGNPVACSAGLAVLDVSTSASFVQAIIDNSKYCIDKLNRLKEKYPDIKDVRGFGYMIGVELTRESAPFVDAMLEKGVLVNSTAVNVVRILPPLIAGRPEFDAMLRIFEDVLNLA